MKAKTKDPKYDGIVILFGEIWLKGRNRETFISALYGNIKAKLRYQQFSKLERLRDRFLIMINEQSDLGAITDILKHVFGISWFSTAVIAENSIEDIVSKSSALTGENEVKIVAHRSYKGTTFNSADIVKAFITRATEKRINLNKNANRELYISVTQHCTIICDNKTKGLGGLPVGCSGRAIILLSGGIDSCVAAFYAMKRGLQPIYVHFHAFPDNALAQHSKIGKLIGILAEYSEDPVSYYVPSHPFQSAILGTNERYELIVFKRFMYRIGEIIADKEMASTIVTGESLGQVASQTAENMIAAQSGADLLIMRPLIGMDKEEIVTLAKNLGTYGLSIEPYKDVCSINSRNPATKAKRSVIDTIYDQAELDRVSKETFNKSLRTAAQPLT